MCGKAVASFLNLPEKKSGKGPAVEDWKNKQIFLSSFHISQRDMLNSLHRVMGTSDSDWEIVYEPTMQRYEAGLKEMKEGQLTGFAKAMYTRYFFPSKDGDFQKDHELANKALGIEEESLDEATKRAVDMVQRGWTPWE